MGGGTRLHDDLGADRHGLYPSLKLPPTQAPAVDDATRTICERQLEHILCQIDGDRRSIHLGLLLVQVLGQLFLRSSILPRKNREESIPLGFTYSSTLGDSWGQSWRRSPSVSED